MKRPTARPFTLCIDIGGSGIKALVLDRDGAQVSARARVPTPRPAKPKAVLRAIRELIGPLGSFDRVSAGFPGVVQDGIVRSAPNLHHRWDGFHLAGALSEATGRPARALNDAGVQGYGVVEGRGVEMLLTFGTGMGCALFLDGRYVPNLELAHHPFRGGKTYEEYVSAAALAALGKRKWNKHVARVVAQVEPIWNPRMLYLGGGNAKHLELEPLPNVRVVENIAGLLGGIALWKDAAPGGEPARVPAAGAAASYRKVPGRRLRPRMPSTPKAMPALPAASSGKMRR